MPKPHKTMMQRVVLGAAAAVTCRMAGCNESGSAPEPEATGEVIDGSPDGTSSDASGASDGDEFHPQRPEFQAIADRLLGGENLYLGYGQIERLDVHWPTSGIRQTFRNVPIDSMIRIVEGEDVFAPLHAPGFEFPAPGTNPLERPRP